MDGFSPGDRLRVAVIGAGYLGRFHALIYSRLPEVELVGVADIDPARAESVAAESGCPAYTSGEDLLDLVDAVSVVVPTSAHLAVARPFLERGIAVLLEKPIAATRAEGVELVELAHRHSAILQIGHLERFNAGVMALAERIRNPRYLEAQRLGVFSGRATDVDVVSDLMIHDLDLILSLVGAGIRRISAIGAAVLTEHLDIANARIEFDNGVVANLVASRISTQPLRRLRVFQPGAYLSLDFIHQTLDLAEPKPVAGQSRPEIVRRRLQIEPVKPLDLELAEFVRVVRTGGRPLVDGEAGLRALEVALEVRERILQGASA